MGNNLNSDDRKALKELENIIVDVWKDLSMKRLEGHKKTNAFVAMVAVAAYRKGFEDGQANK
jgi:hypothetical protein